MAPAYHERRLRQRLHDPEFRAEFERASQHIVRVDALVNAFVEELDRLRQEAGMSKADLAREVGRDPANLRRLFSTDANPTLKTFAAILDALGAEDVSLTVHGRTVSLIELAREAARQEPIPA